MIFDASLCSSPESDRAFDEVGLRLDGRVPRLSFSRREAAAVTAGLPREQRFVAFDPEGYFLEFETFLDDPQNAALRRALGK